MKVGVRVVAGLIGMVLQTRSIEKNKETILVFGIYIRF